MILQPWSGTTLCLGSITNVTSYLSSSHHFTVLWICTRQPPCPNSPTIVHPLTDLQRSLKLIIPPIKVLDRLSTWKIFHPLRTPPPVLALTFLPTTTYPPVPCRTLQPCTVILFLLPRPPSGRPHFSALNVANVHVNPCRFTILVFVLPPSLLKPLIPSFRPQPAAWS